MTLPIDIPDEYEARSPEAMRKLPAWERALIILIGAVIGWAVAGLVVAGILWWAGVLVP